MVTNDKFRQRDKAEKTMGNIYNEYFEDLKWSLASYWRITEQGHRHKSRGLVRENVKTCVNL